MKQTPQIRLVFTLTKRDGTDFERDAVTSGLGILFMCDKEVIEV